MASANSRSRKKIHLDPANRPDDRTLVEHMLGPTGNLRAPTLRIGATLLVGYNDEVYQQALGIA